MKRGTPNPIEPRIYVDSMIYLCSRGHVVRILLMRIALASSLLNRGYFVMEWPANSPDMNAIEHLWSRIKRELHVQFSDTKQLTGGPEMIKAQLTERLRQVWWSIDEEFLETLIRSMPDRVREILDARGWYTKY